MGLVSKDMLWIVMNVIIWELELKEFEDNKGVIRIRKSKKDRQHNGQKGQTMIYKTLHIHFIWDEVPTMVEIAIFSISLMV